MPGGVENGLRRQLLATFIYLVASLTLAPYVLGQGAMNRAGLVIQHGDGTTFSTCVAFEEPSITGLELLRRAGVSISVDSSGGLGTAICALAGEGCSYPEENCFCQCQGTSCTYWQYWHLIEDEWQYSGIGAAGWKVMDGGVDGWVWGQGDPNGGERPPAASFDELCAHEPTVTPPASQTQALGQGPESTVATALVQPSPAQPTKPAAPRAVRDDRSSPTAFLAFIAIVLALVILMARQLRRT